MEQDPKEENQQSQATLKKNLPEWYVELVKAYKATETNLKPQKRLN